jgi:2-keto-4-pentenoate hydratase
VRVPSASVSRPDDAAGGGVDVHSIADSLLSAFDSGSLLSPITRHSSGFTIRDAYAVLERIASVRTAKGWQPAGRKIGFTNRTIWERYGVEQPMWAHVWTSTVLMTRGGTGSVALEGLAQPRIEPEVVFKLRADLSPTERPEEVISAVEWIAAGFEVVQCHYPDWGFTLADCTADFGLHARLLVGEPVTVDPDDTRALTAIMPTFELVLARNRSVVARGIGANVLDGPLHALAHLTRVLANQPEFAPLRAGEIITTGTITDAHPIQSGDRWESDYGELGLHGLCVTFT